MTRDSSAISDVPPPSERQDRGSTVPPPTTTLPPSGLLPKTTRDEARGLLTSGIAHDLNNYLQVVRGGLAIIDRDAPLPKRLERTRRGIHGALERCEELTRCLLRYGEAEERTIRGSCELDAAVVESAALVEGLLGDRIRYEHHLGAGRARVPVDRTRLEQLLLNLVVNARDAMPSGGTLTVETRRCAAPPAAASAACLTVRDTGCGISPEDLARIFEPLFTTKGPERGTGLGLAAVRWAMDGIGGTVEATSELGLGSAFHLYFPLVS